MSAAGLQAFSLRPSSVGVNVGSGIRTPGSASVLAPLPIGNQTPVTVLPSTPAAPTPAAPAAGTGEGAVRRIGPSSPLSSPPIATPTAGVAGGATPANGTAGSPSLASILGPGYTFGEGDAGTGTGGDTSLPPPSTANVDALAPTSSTTSSSGPSIVLVVLVVAAIAIGGYFWWRHHKKAKAAPDGG